MSVSLLVSVETLTAIAVYVPVAMSVIGTLWFALRGSDLPAAPVWAAE